MARRITARKRTIKRKPVVRKRTRAHPKTIVIRVRVRPYRKQRITESRLRKVPDYRDMSSSRMSVAMKQARAEQNWKAARYNGDIAKEQKYFNEYVKWNREAIKIAQREAGFI